jgi:4-diphosphocytidyl-2-C-methyl-D-erythritol kinase
MESIVVKAFAKVNLTLDVLRKRPDGYHDVEMIMQQISLFDEVTLRPLPSGIRVFTGHNYVPDDETNIGWKAAKRFFDETGIQGGVDIVIKKNIPVAAGLAGGSTDAAAVLRGLNSLFSAGLSLEQLMVIGKAIGADVPFCLKGGTCLSEGIGERLTEISVHTDYWIILVKPPVGVSTREVYESLSIERIRRHPDTLSAKIALEEGNVYHLAQAMYNVLEEVTADKLKSIPEIKSRLMSYGAKRAMMSGSGPTVFGIFTRQDRAERALKNIKRHYQEAFIVRPIAGGMRDAK